MSEDLEAGQSMTTNEEHTLSDEADDRMSGEARQVDGMVANTHLLVAEVKRLKAEVTALRTRNSELSNSYRSARDELEDLVFDIDLALVILTQAVQERKASASTDETETPQAQTVREHDVETPDRDDDDDMLLSRSEGPHFPQGLDNRDTSADYECVDDSAEVCGCQGDVYAIETTGRGPAD